MGWQDRAYNREDEGGPPIRLAMPPMTTLAWVLIGVCLTVFIAQAATARAAGASPLIYWGALTFADARAFTQPWRWITYQYLHGGGGHIFGNLLTIFFFVPLLEARWGWRRTLVFYTAGGIVAGITYGLMQLVLGQIPPIIGASGAVLAVLGAVAYLMPEISIFGLIPIRFLAGLYALLYLLTIIGDRNVSDAAHLGGLAFGFFAPRFGGNVWYRYQRRWQERRKKAVVEDELAEQVTIDRILEKVHQSGMNSLSWSEKRALKKATERQRQRDLETARRRR